MGDFLFFFQISKFRFSPAYLALLTAEWRNIRLKSSGVIVRIGKHREQEILRWVQIRDAQKVEPIYSTGNIAGRYRIHIPDRPFYRLRKELYPPCSRWFDKRCTDGHPHSPERTTHRWDNCLYNENNRRIEQRPDYRGKVQRSYQFSQEEERAFAGNNQLGIFPIKPRPARTAQ